MQFRYIVQFLYRHLSNVRFSTVLTFMLAHYFVSYGLFTLAGEEALTRSHIHYVYYWVVTCSTIGYGDATPVTDGGKLITAFFMIPTSVALFGVFLAKLSNVLILQFRKEINGMRDYHSSTNHILIMGYHPLRTQEIVHLIQSDTSRPAQQILVVSCSEDTHPFMGQKGVDFCRVLSLKDPASLARVALEHADKIIVDGKDDNESFVLASHYASLNSNAYISTYIADISSADNLQRQFKNIEVIVDNREELMVRALMDTGSSRMVSQLLRSDQGPTFFVTEISIAAATTAQALSEKFAQHGGTFLGFALDAQSKDLHLNPQPQHVIPTGTVFTHYIASQRIDAAHLV